MGMIDRQARDLPLDAHVHTDLSHDSAVPIDDLRPAGRRARASPSSRSPITSTSRPARPGYGETTFEQRERVVRDAAERWAERGVAIRFGVEITWDSRYATEIRDHLARHAYDFVIGSVHIYRDSPYAADHVAGWVAGRSLAEIVAPYFDEVAAGARTGLFDAMGHIDFVKRFLVPHVHHRGPRRGARAVRADPGALVESGTALEINTSGLRSPAEETFPSPADRGALPRDGRPRRHGRLGCPHAPTRSRGPWRTATRPRPRPDSRRWPSVAAASRVDVELDSHRLTSPPDVRYDPRRDRDRAVGG